MEHHLIRSEVEEQNQTLVRSENARVLYWWLAGISGAMDGALVTIALARQDFAYIIPGAIFSAVFFIATHEFVNRGRASTDGPEASSHHISLE